jgi:hypothetical protein
MNSDMDCIFESTTVPTWALIVVALFTIPTLVPRLLFAIAGSQYVGGQLQILHSNIKDLDLYIVNHRDHLPFLSRTQAIEPELEK